MERLVTTLHDLLKLLPGLQCHFSLRTFEHVPGSRYQRSQFIGVQGDAVDHRLELLNLHNLDRRLLFLHQVAFDPVQFLGKLVVVHLHPVQIGAPAQ